MGSSTALLAAGLSVWLVAVLVQVGDLGTLWIDLRGARRTPSTSRSLRTRANTMFWVVPVASIVVVGVGVGIVLVAREAAQGTPSLAALVGVPALALAVAALVFLALLVTSRRDDAGYAALLLRLREHDGERLTAAQLADLHAEFTDVDGRRSRIRLGVLDRWRLLGLRGELARQARDARRSSAPPRWFPWRGSLLFLVTASAWRLLPLLAAAFFSTALLVSATGPVGLLLAILAPVASAAAALANARVALTVKVAWQAEALELRDEVVQRLLELDRSARKGVAGLGDRVTRALQILREQQQ